VLARVLDALPGDEAEVVAVTEDVVQLVSWKHARAALCGCSLRQSSTFDLFRQAVQAVLARRVRLEGPEHVFGTVGIEVDGANLMAVHDFPHVEVAERRHVRCAPRGHLLLRALDDFVGKVARVELGDRAHDAVHQRAARRLVDVLSDTDELGT
jgi:hypothetical protein